MTEHPFETMSWHDNLIHGLQLRAPDPDRGDWRSELVLDIDHIVEWVRADDKSVQFRVAPATLNFQDVTYLRISFYFGGGAHRHTMNELSIADITTQPAPPLGIGSAAYFLWRIALNSPQGGEIAFGASGYTLTLRADPVLLDDQRLPPADRPHLLQSS